MNKLALLVLVAACTRGEHREARAKYNEGIGLLQQGDFDGAEKALLEARSNAGVDPELRYRAAYDLGMAYAAHADKVKKDKDGDLAKALELEQQAVSWFSDAVKLRKDGDAEANLATVRARAQAIADELRRAEGKLEARLDKVIGEQRKILEGARGAWVQIKQAGGADPLAQQGALTQLADQERGIVAEAGTIGDMADDEIDSIGKKPEDKRAPDEKARIVQLKNLDIYVLDARARIAEARRKLQDLAAEDAVARSEAALVSLKRAREQLLQPIDVLREVAGDEMSLFQETAAVAQVETGKLAGSAAEPAPVIPAWMEPPVLGDRQGGLRDRVEEVRSRVQAASEHTNDDQLKPEQKKLLQMYVDALPFVTDASTAMDRAHTALSANKLADAQAAERDALVALSKAIERFADLKQTIDLASDTQKQLVKLLSPEGAKVPDRATEAKDALDANTARMTRIKDLIAEQLAQVAEQEKQLEAAGSGAGSAAQQAEAQKQQVEQAKQLFGEAERLRGEAEKAVGELDAAVKANKDPLTPAKAADAKLDELRRLFFNVVEHLQDLIRRQGETRDQTNAAQAEDEIARAPKLPDLDSREAEHGQLAKAITDKLAEMADAAGKQPQQQPGAPTAKNLADATAEVRLAQGDMTDAKGQLDQAVSTKNQSFSLDPAVKSQAKAIEHLENALRLLQPPKQQKQDQDQDKQQQQQQQQKQQQQQQQQGGAGQRARDMDAQRQKDKQQHEAAGDAVDKDW